MGRFSSQTCRREVGFSFVELLVTIVIAGIAFAAIVPMFVGAQQKSSGDNMRNIATQMARDKIEKIRQLDYDLIAADKNASPLNNLDPAAPPNLYNRYFAAGQFGSTVAAESGGGSSKTLQVDYIVTPVPANAPVGQEQYKQVTVVVRWTAPPSPVSPAVISTMVYKQYAGPQIITFQVDPQVLEQQEPDVYWVTGTPVTVDVQIAPNDIALMNAKLTPIDDANKKKMGYVRFTVSTQNGSESLTENVYQEYNGENGHYQFVWDNSLVADGVYTIAATAYSSSQQEGTSMSMSFWVAVKIPPPPSNLVGTIGDGLVSLTWGAPSIGDLSHYELWRSTPGSDAWQLHADDLLSPSYTDASVTNLVDYYYKVRVVDTDGNNSLFSNVAGPLQPHVLVDVTPPATPGGFTVAKVAGQRAITLTWAASTDPGSPSSGVKGYSIERSLNGSTWAQIVSADAFNLLTYTDVSVAWNTQYYYRVCAVDGVNLPSPWTAGLSAITDAQPKWNLTVANTNTGESIKVWVQSVTTGRFWWGGVNPSISTTSKPGAYEISKKKSGTFYQLPQDTYNVWTEGEQSQSVTLTAAGTVSFSK
jgi:type II secretory pathway pseudopilin PulG